MDSRTRAHWHMQMHTEDSFKDSISRLCLEHEQGRGGPSGREPKPLDFLVCVLRGAG